MEQFLYLQDYFDAHPDLRRVLNCSKNSVMELLEVDMVKNFTAGKSISSL